MSRNCNIDTNALLVALSLITDLVCLAGAILYLIGAMAFQTYIIEIYVAVVCIILFISDIYQPVVCANYFSFMRYYWGRALMYLFLGALVAGGAGYPLFACIWTWIVAFVFLLLFFYNLSKGGASQGGTVNPYRAQGGGSTGGGNVSKYSSKN
jgi:hypothetical protein